jgi:cystathionine beta-lyase/cystathionine gamma-synthase
LRFSVGIEDKKDLIADIEQALEACREDVRFKT